MHEVETLTSEQHPNASGASPARHKRITAPIAALLLLIFIMGGYFRWVGLNWDDFTHLHPDERFLTQVLAAVGGNLNLGTDLTANERMAVCMERYPASNGRGLYFNGYFDSQCSALNPNNLGFGLYVYGTLPLFIADIASDRFAELSYMWDTWTTPVTDESVVQASRYDVWRGYNGAHLVWRALNGAADLLVIGLIFLIGRRMHSSWVGLLAAALYAAAPLPIQKAHFATVNSMANLFAVFALYFAVRVQDNGRWGDYFGFGLAFAAALASRINLVPLVVLILAAAMLRMLPIVDWRLAEGERRRIFMREFGGLVLAGIVTIVGFRIFQPYAFAGPGIIPLQIDFNPLQIHIFNDAWLENMGQAQYLVSGEAESPPNWQWVNRTGYVYPLTNMVLWGMGLLMGISAWFGWLWAGVRVVQARPLSLRNLLPVVWILVYFAWIGNLWVMSMRYYLPLYPALAILAGWALIAGVQRAQQARPLWRGLAWAALCAVTGFTVLWGAMFTNIYRNQLTRVQASHWVWENVPGDFSIRLEDAPPNTPLINIALFNPFGSEWEIQTSASILEPAIDYNHTFSAPADGTIREIFIPHLGTPSNANVNEHTLRMAIYTEDGTGLLSQGTLSGTFPTDNHPIGESYTVPLEAPVSVRAGELYRLQVRVESEQTLLVSGAIVSNEGPWDDPVPTIVCEMPDGITLADNPPPGLNVATNCNGKNAYGGLISGFAIPTAWEDVPQKRIYMKQALDQSDYIIISSNRFYDTITRNPKRWPLTVAYYQALFDGSLGYDLVATFQETYELGFLRVSDQHLPTMQSPAWLNEFEAEEAFHVYDHPVVFVFAKSERYTPQNTSILLDSIVLNRAEEVAVGSFNDPRLIGANPLYSLPADPIPTQLQLSPAAKEIQYSGGTWSERFNSASLLSTNPFAAVIGWWLLIILLGWAVFPLMFALFPSLADRGYSASKFVGMFVVAWFAWFMTSLQWRLWSAGGLWLTLGLVLALSGVVGYQQRAALREYVRRAWGHMLAIEIITLTAFLFFLGVRLSNPDLWHNIFGGEKPMDFAYFNGVLRSTVFPPIDPWHAGGYINYYYFGFVLVGAPVLMLQMVPSVAYNLIIPTLFAVTGIGAFSVAFNVIEGFRHSAENIRRPTPLTLSGSPWTAGIMALILAVLLGNLNTPRVFMEGVVSLGGYTPNSNMVEYMRERFTERNGRPPVDNEVLEMLERAASPTPLDQIGMSLDDTLDVFTAFRMGIWRMFSEGAPLNIATNRWYWASTRILAEPPISSGNAITEMPYFTFLYGDLHAHMISMPMQFFVLLFLLHEVLNAGKQNRSTLASVLAIGLGAAAVGMLRATNTWDLPTYLLLSVLGLGYAWWLRWRTLSRASVWDMFLRIGGFIALSVWLSAPYERWYAATYSSASLWTGVKTPIWAYLVIHGLFLFLLVTLLIWETSRWLRSIPLMSLRGRKRGFYVVLAAIGFALVGSLILSLLGWHISVLVVPLLLWCVLLFFRPHQSRPMQFILVVAALALGVTLGVEFIVIDGDIGRQNTVFKFYLQGWLMFSVVGGVALAWLLDGSFEWHAVPRGAWLFVLGLLIGIASLYPLMATQARTVDRMAPQIGLTLNGMDYMQAAQHYEVTNSTVFEAEVLDLSHDYNVIRWLQENVEGTPVLMEAQSEREYLWGSRMSIYTGMPSVIGWNWHQRQQRTFNPMPLMVQQRVANVNAFYTTTDIRVAAEMLQHYGVSYVIVSTLELARYPQEGIDKFGTMEDMGILTSVYTDGVATVYAVDLQAARATAVGIDLSETVARAQ